MQTTLPETRVNEEPVSGQLGIEKFEPERLKWIDRPLLKGVSISWEIILISVIILLAIVSRFVGLEARVISHDETIHVYHNSWSLYRGLGYQHDPLSHGPLQTHLVALSYFLFGASDFSARVPAAIFGIAIVIITWNYRRYIGKNGALVAMLLMLISPYLLYYGRYVRNDIFSALFGIVMIWSVLRYLETGKDRYAYILTGVYALHFTAKETSFIYAAQILVFLAFYLIYRLIKNSWARPDKRTKFIAALFAGLILLSITGGFMLINRQAPTLSPTETVQPAVPGEELTQMDSGGPSTVVLFLGLGSIFAFLVAAYYLLSGYLWSNLRNERSFGLLVLLGSFVLPQLSAFPVNFMGWNIPTNATEVKALTMQEIFQIGIFFVPMLLFSIGIGLVWNRKLWLKNAVIFYAIYTILYTTVFTNGAGFFTGMVGSLGYWLEQQGVERGSQPWYYYVFVQIPIYEYLPAIASLVALVLVFLGFRPKKPIQQSDEVIDEVNDGITDGETEESSLSQATVAKNADDSEDINLATPENFTEILKTDPDNDPEASEIRATAVLLLGFWAITSVLAYTIAGEKMPWLTVHLVWPLILFGSWAIGKFIDTVDWTPLKTRRGWLTIVTFAVFLISGTIAVSSLLGTDPPFQGRELENLQHTSTFLVALIAMTISGVGLYSMIKSWNIRSLQQIILVLVMSGMALLTARTAYTASFINYDYANELLVYAHSAGGVKEVMDQVDEISIRTTDGYALAVAHDGEYPFWWYLRNYHNAVYFGQNPTRSLRENPVIIVGEGNFGKIEPVVGQGYNRYDYIRLWWPNQDYFNLTLERVINAITNPEMRAALFQIWLNRDYTKYGEVTGKDMSLPNWSPSSRMRLYVRKDIASQIWNYGVLPAAEEIVIDPYDGKQVELEAERIIGAQGVEPGQFQRPRGIALAPDGSLYIADTENNRIQHLALDGSVLHVWGQFGDATTGQALGGTFNQPWGIAVDSDGSVFVADTWNHRIQKFSPEGEFLLMWGYFGQAEQPSAFWGPRDVAVDAQGRVYVTDTGNKRIVVFDDEGNFITEFGTVGLSPGEFDEPVGIDIGPDGRVYVADTWNQRVQIFDELAERNFQVVRFWDVAAWFGQSLDNKPFLAVNPDGHVFATDPEGYRVLEFLNNGDIIRYWGDFGSGAGNFGLAGAVTLDDTGGVWVTDAGNSRVMYFNLSGLTE